MKVYIIIALVPILCLNLTIITKFFRPIEENDIQPIFEDFIITDISETYNDKREISEEWKSNDLDDLSSLHAVLKTQLSKINNGPKFISTDNEQQNNISDSEIQNSVFAALQFRSSGKSDKALKLIEYAATIAPNNPDILNYYGEILEDSRKDVIAADHLYLKALKHCPNHKGALTNRQRTADVVEQLDLEMFKTIDEKRDILKSIPNTDNSFHRFKKQAYYLHIYHTVGIEGNTMTVEQLRYLLETGKAVFGKSIIEHNEILGLQLAMKYVKLLVRFEYIGVKEILGIHRRVLGHVDPLSSGYFRDTQVFVGSHVPPSPDKLGSLMQEYVDWLNSDEAINMHPVRHAALAHYKLVDIHPFQDGNGRTSRLLMNLILIRAGYPPVIILKEHRRQYYEHLKLANRGDVRPFVRFIAQCTEQVLDLYLWGLQKLGEHPNIEDLSSKTISLETEDFHMINTL